MQVFADAARPGRGRPLTSRVRKEPQPTYGEEGPPDMTGDGARDGSNPNAVDAEGDDFEKGDFSRLEQEMSPLLDSVGAFAREEDAEIGTYAANTSHALSD